MKVDKYWWKKLFGEVYLTTDARTINNPLLTKREVDFLENFLQLKEEDKILDFCGGQGRHSLELARRGYKDLTVLDYSKFLINRGKEEAKKKKLNIKFVRADARYPKLKKESFSVVFMIGNCLGYFLDKRENLKILKSAYRLLKNKGKFLVDIPNQDYLKKRFKPISIHQADKKTLVIRKRVLKDNTIRVREIVISKTRLIRDTLYCQLLYDLKELKNILRKIDFQKITSYTFLTSSEKDLGLMSSRIFVRALK
ncbi:MAG TPA: class I SAM-dependent methyltransferase [Candidatus Omnitrophica bacterium]|nr:class I SAM-dependent methyltransferase [Candidatus Omnitrophota bacterium]